MDCDPQDEVGAVFEDTELLVRPTELEVTIVAELVGLEELLVDSLGLLPLALPRTGESRCGWRGTARTSSEDRERWCAEWRVEWPRGDWCGCLW